MKTRYRILIVLSVLLALGSDLYAQYTISICQQKVEANYPLVKKYDLVEQSRSFNLKNAIWYYRLHGKALSVRVRDTILSGSHMRFIG